MPDVKLSPTRRGNGNQTVARCADELDHKLAHGGSDLSEMLRVDYYEAYTINAFPPGLVVATCPANGQLDIHRVSFDALDFDLIEGATWQAIYDGSEFLGSVRYFDEWLAGAEYLFDLLIDTRRNQERYTKLSDGKCLDWRAAVANDIDRIFRDSRAEVAS